MAKKKITLAQLLTDKKVIEDKKWTYESETLGGVLEIEKIKPQKVLDIIEEISDEKIDQYTAFSKLIYESCSIFRSQELIKKYEVEIPYQVVDRVFDRNIIEILELGKKICVNYGVHFEAEETIKKQ